MAKTEIIGSWYNTGYHGHFRSKSRSDFLNEYRHIAKPIPPNKYVNRSQQAVTKHVFSLHDNRNSFTTDALYFEQGLGRRRFKQGRFGFKPDLLTWAPQKEELSRAGPKSSVYKVDFRGIPREPIKQQIVKRPKTSFDEDSRKDTTSYRYAHGEDNPNKEILNAMCNDGLDTTLTRRKTGSSISGRESVASCMSWYVPRPPTRPMVPVGTQTAPAKKMTPAATEIVPTTAMATAPAAMESAPMGSTVKTQPQTLCEQQAM